MVTQAEFEDFINNLIKQIEGLAKSIEGLVKGVNNRHNTPSPASLATLKTNLEEKKESDSGTEKLKSVLKEGVDLVEDNPSDCEDSESLHKSSTSHKFEFAPLFPDEGKVNSTFLDYQEGKSFILRTNYVNDILDFQNRRVANIEVEKFSLHHDFIKEFQQFEVIRSCLYYTKSDSEFCLSTLASSVFVLKRYLSDSMFANSNVFLFDEEGDIYCGKKLFVNMSQGGSIPSYSCGRLLYDRGRLQQGIPIFTELNCTIVHVCGFLHMGTSSRIYSYSSLDFAKRLFGLGKMLKFSSRNPHYASRSFKFYIHILNSRVASLNGSFLTLTYVWKWVYELAVKLGYHSDSLLVYSFVFEIAKENKNCDACKWYDLMLQRGKLSSAHWALFILQLARENVFGGAQWMFDLMPCFHGKEGFVLFKEWTYNELISFLHDILLFYVIHEGWIWQLIQQIYNPAGIWSSQVLAVLNLEDELPCIHVYPLLLGSLSYDSYYNLWKMSFFLRRFGLMVSLSDFTFTSFITASMDSMRNVRSCIGNFRESLSFPSSTVGDGRWSCNRDTGFLILQLRNGFLNNRASRDVAHLKICVGAMKQDVVSLLSPEWFRCTLVLGDKDGHIGQPFLDHSVVEFHNPKDEQCNPPYSCQLWRCVNHLPEAISFKEFLVYWRFR